MTPPADRAVLAFFAQLARSGVRHIVIAPGSRNTPLTLAASLPDSPFETLLHLDERSAGYFALGLARQTGRPVAVSCTSGTAAANFLPAVVEARLSRVPLLVLTADRPTELRDIGAPQTIDQVRMYGSHAKWAADLPVADGDPAVERAWAATAARIAALALEAPPGPVHVNLPFREPLLEPGGPPRFATAGGATLAPTTPGRREPASADVARLAEACTGRRGLVLCGPESMGLPADAIVALADALGWPVLADPLSGLRAGDHALDGVVETYDALVREPAFLDAAEPEVVIRFGAGMTSKPLNQWLGGIAGLEAVVVDPAGGWRDPEQVATAMVTADPAAFCAALGAALAGRAAADAGWRRTWVAANGAARGVLRDAVTALGEPFEGALPLALADALPDGATLVAGNSMPVRDIDSFFPATNRRIRIVGTRGASGIDGVVSTAAGAAAARSGPVALLIGDLSFLHDLNGLWPVGRHGLDLTVLLVNNDGGGIFHFLPQRQQAPDQFEPWFGTPHGLDLAHAVALHGGRHGVLDGATDITAAIAAALARPGLDVLELRTERDRNVALHRQVWARVAEAVRGAVAVATPAGD